MPRLDGIRALAVAGVLVSHAFWWLPAIAVTNSGGIGVRLFFVLSGFLITRILLDYRDRMTVGEAARSFYWRRFLRLAPPFYFAIIASALLGIANMRTDWVVHALYLSNFLIAARESWEPVGHLWSLAVEEQFYLAWFAVVVWLPRRWLLPSIVAGLLSAPAFRLWTSGWAGHPGVLTPAVIDSLAIGSLAGLASLRHPRLYAALASWPLCLAGFAGIVTFPMIGGTLAMKIGYGLSINLFSVALVALAATEAPMTKWLQLAPLRDMGRISYGLYVYHLFVPLLLYQLGVRFSNRLEIAGWMIVGTFAIAIASWFLLERPALQQKDAIPRLFGPRAAYS